MVVDGALVQRMFDTLIGNAVKFSPMGSIVTIKLTMSDRAEVRCAQLEVTDAGPAVPVAMLAQLFAQLEQNDTQYPDRPNTSIGLAFCRMVAEAHGGTISVRDNPTGGAIFTVELCPEIESNYAVGEKALVLA